MNARRAVLADVNAPTLYGELVAPEHVPDAVHRRLEGFQWETRR